MNHGLLYIMNTITFLLVFLGLLPKEPRNVILFSDVLFKKTDSRRVGKFVHALWPPNT